MAEEKTDNKSPLLELVCGFNHAKLKKTQTRVTTIDGRITTYEKDSTGKLVVKEALPGSLGYVCDTRQDLQVGEVLPGLIMGSQDLALNVELLRKYQVTHILNIATFVSNLDPNQFRYLNINILDDPCVNIMQYFEQCFNFIEQGRNAGCALVHCNAGVSRSATIVIAYLMQSRGMKYLEAFRYLKEKRPAICPNEGFRTQLQQFEKQLASQTQNVER
ncbi:hypothetical protein CHS0354_023234 [Potamilus streckersoni]|uniref:protein-serine/threonine phosphatase n=1 Tax=Potamilus streckersoni TaxID=2493646 RepID=A0AAE0SJ82_9BIVA|nr:hypothetical protein CHS0354_023234 [Potamilus streckersoni]